MEERPKRTNVFPWLIGCAAAIVAVGLLCAVGGWFGVRYLAEKGFEIAVGAVEEQVRRSGLPPEQVESMQADLLRLEEAFRDGRFEFERLEGLEQEFERVLELGVVQWYSTQVLAETDLPEEEREAGRRVLQRLQRALQEGQVTLDEVQGFDVRVDSETRERGHDPAEVRRLLAAVEEKVDALGVPDEPFQADVAGAFRELVDGLIAE